MQDPTNDSPRAAEDIRIERARHALADYRGTDLGGMSVGEMAGWLGRFSVVLQNLLEHVDQTPARPDEGEVSA